MTERIPGASVYDMRIPGVGPQGPEARRDWPEYVGFITDALVDNAKSMAEVYRVVGSDIAEGRRMLAVARFAVHSHRPLPVEGEGYVYMNVSVEEG